MLNGVETDTDCGGPDCAPCADDQRYMRYEVDGVIYESRFASITATRAVGTVTVADMITVSGGLAHNISFVIKDSNETPNNFTSGTYLLNNTELTVAVNNCTLLDNDGDSYQSETDGQGITAIITSISFLMPPPPPAVNNSVVEGTFTGRVYAVGLGYRQITNGEFRAYFSN